MSDVAEKLNRVPLLQELAEVAETGSVRELAKHIGIGKSAVYDWINAEEIPSTSIIDVQNAIKKLRRQQAQEDMNESVLRRQAHAALDMLTADRFREVAVMVIQAARTQMDDQWGDVPPATEAARGRLAETEPKPTSGRFC